MKEELLELIDWYLKEIELCKKYGKYTDGTKKKFIEFIETVIKEN
jgi:hypothetical protein